ncbi:Protein prenyltransferase [Cordyceps militaris]|uniref:Protein prenyltransferase n=1 Tax=Cordyceps militaris TaxID=73501 RepID=A0A2H4SL22_CORMI|nr:Protein prenyltransferase [Cordyceps militaris]
MSRALDAKVKEALEIEDNASVYRSVADVLCIRHDELLDIEVLGPSHILPHGTYVLQEENAVAIPKLNILRAFLPAYKIFKRHIDYQDVTPDELLRATSVMLLLDPEHMTAANARKRQIQQIEQGNMRLLDIRIDAEFYFIDSLLTSRLHRHTKSPTLWGHRQWLLELCTSMQRPVDSLPTALAKLIFISAERHPRNYYAWCHARYLLDLASRQRQHAAPDRGTRWPPQQEQDAAALEALTDAVKTWCFSHHDDTSGWSFLTVLIARRPQAAAIALFTETLGRAEAFSWRGESVWYFLRNMLRADWLPDGHHRAQFERVLELVHGRVAEPEQLDRQVLGHMLEWVKMYAASN